MTPHFGSRDSAGSQGAPGEREMQRTMSETNRRFDVLLGANDRLRRSRRRWQLAGVGTTTCLVLLVIGGADGRPPQTVEAGEFVLRSKDGAMRASLTIRPDGTPGLGLFD